MLILILLALTPIVAFGQSESRLLDRAMVSAGGPDRLAALPALEWEATATIRLPDQDIRIAGIWRIKPPDSAEVTTWLVDQGPASSRRLVLAGDSGWGQRGDDPRQALPAGFLLEEKHQFYLYYLLRLLPLKDSGFHLVEVAPDSTGEIGLRVSHAGHPDAVLLFDSTARVTGIRTVFAAANPAQADSQEIRLSGSIEVEGVRWFRRMEIRRAGRPYFEMEIAALRKWNK
jgi:hypothetical protein